MTARNEMLAKLLGEFPDIVLVLDATGILLWANHTAELTFGQNLQDAIGQSALDYVHPDDLEIVLRSFESIQGKQTGNLLEVRVRINDQWRLIELIGGPVSWFKDGAILFSLRDVTERRRFEIAHDDNARFRSLVHNATTITVLVSPEGNVDSVSGALTRLLGHDPETIEHRPLADLVVEEDWPAFTSSFHRALSGATAIHPVIQVVRLRRRGSDEGVVYELSFVNLIDDPTVGGLVVTANDVSSRVHAERDLQGALLELRDTFSLLHATLESTADGLLVVDKDRKISSYNRQFATMWHIPEDVLASRDDFQLLAHVVDQLEDPVAFLSRVEEFYAQPGVESLDMIKFKDGRSFERSSKPQYVAGDVVGRVWSFRDVTEQKQLEDDLAHLAFHDVLTGLANRALFRDRLSQAVARSERTGKYVAVMFLDLDNFKTINDSLGHLAGDELLRSVGDGLSACLRRSDTAARLGGDEFAVLVEDVDSHDEVVMLADRILEALRRPITIMSRQVSVTVSIGITFGKTGASSEQLLTNADLAMYLAKAQGKDRYEEFHDQMHTAVVARLELEADLRAAIAEHQFVVHYQPILNLVADRIVGFEALVRWLHPHKGLLQPIDFIPFAEEIGLIEAIDHFVLNEACAQARRWQDQDLAHDDLMVSVNLSARELVEVEIASRVAESLRTSRFNPNNLVLEITESAVMRDLEAAVINLRTLKGLGLRIAVDDFGTGYSSFVHLERLPIDILKIDQSFVAPLANMDGPGEIVNAIIQLARTLGLVAIAEGVEGSWQAARLREMGCELAQGYYLGVPMSAEDTELLLAAERDARLSADDTGAPR